MKPDRLFSIVAERALTASRPLHDELAAAGALTGSLPPAVTRAIDFAQAGKLGEALGALSPLGFDPLLAEACALRPEVASEVSQALSRLPRLSDLLRPLFIPLIYLTAVVLFEAGVAVALVSGILPALAAGIPEASPLLSAGEVAQWAALTLALVALVVEFGAIRHPSVRRLLEGPLASARVCAAFAPLAAAGVPAEQALVLARRHAPLLAHELARAPRTAVDWSELAAYFSERGVSRVTRFGVWVRSAGTAVAVLLAFSIVSTVYLTLPWLSSLGGTQ